ncbi:MAG: hypothetical protein ACT4PT_01075 [Methanobacteriota archaeon]
MVFRADAGRKRGCGIFVLLVPVLLFQGCIGAREPLPDSPEAETQGPAEWLPVRSYRISTTISAAAVRTGPEPRAYQAYGPVIDVEVTEGMSGLLVEVSWESTPPRDLDAFMRMGTDSAMAVGGPDEPGAYNSTFEDSLNTAYAETNGTDDRPDTPLRWVLLLDPQPEARRLEVFLAPKTAISAAPVTMAATTFSGSPPPPDFSAL